MKQPAFRCLFALGFSFLLTVCYSAAFAQEGNVAGARRLTEEKNYKEAAAVYEKLYPQDATLYNEYLEVLLSQQDWKAAEQLVKQQQAKGSTYPVIYAIDLGRVYEAAGKQKKAEEQYQQAVSAVNGDDMLVQQLATAFQTAQKPAYAVQVYEQAVAVMHNPFLYSGQMARLYTQLNETDKAVSILLEAAPSQPNGIDDSKTALLEVLGTDAKKIQSAQKAVVKKINLQPDNPYYAEILTWLYTMKDDWDGALLQIQALDERNREDGRRLMSFAQTAEKEKQYDAAQKALDAVLEKGKDAPLYIIAAAQKLEVAFVRLQDNPSYTAADVAALEKDYAAFFAAYPQYAATQTARDYATLEALFAGKPQQAIEILQMAINAPTTSREFAGNAKLQLGDYQALTGNVWEASLTYSQVDKAFREDALGEDARYRNAKLAYYRGDFQWAQGQLSVLKASTSELIANDALYLSVLITENTEADSNLVPLRRFATADMLLFQNKDKEAETLLDSVAKAFPKHALNDDILLLRAKLAQKHKDYSAALGYLAQIHTQYGKDVLGDDALYQSALINERFLKKPDEAKKLYEQLIIEYPGSTYVQTARQQLAALNAGGAL